MGKVGIKTPRHKSREHFYVRDTPGCTGKRRYKYKASDRCDLHMSGTCQRDSRRKQSAQKSASTFLRSTNVSLAFVKHARVVFHVLASGRETCSTGRASATNWTSVSYLAIRVL